MKRILSVMAALIIVLALGVTAMAAQLEDKAILTITPDVTEIPVGGKGEVVFTIKLAPSAGNGITAAGITIEGSEGTELVMTKVTTQGGNGYWVNQTGLFYMEGLFDNGIFTAVNIEQLKDNGTPVANTLIAQFTGGDETKDRSLKDEAVLVTVKAKVDTSKEGEYSINVLDANIWKNGNDKYTNEIVSTSVKVVCAHSGETEIKNAVPASCKDGYTGDVYCKDCGKEIAKGEVIPGNDQHVGGTATCDKGAVCEICKTEYTEPHHANTELRNVKTAYCKETGYTGDLWCLDCETELEKGEVIPEDENNHYNDYPPKDPEYVGVQEATCTTPGFTGALVHAYCGHWIQAGTTTPINPDNHKDSEGNAYPTELDEDSAVMPDCKNNGKEADEVCSGCKAVINEGKEIPATGNHGGGEANCQQGALCAGCGTEYTEPDKNVHVNTEVRNAKEETCGTDGYTGDTYCKDCGELAKQGEVIPATGEHEGGKATCSNKAECAECGKEYGELDPETHEKEYTIIKEPTCTEAGERAVSCKCGEALPNEAIEPLGHEMGNWVVVKSATKKEEGLKRRDCERCDYYEEKVIPKVKDTANSIIIDMTGKGQASGEESNPNTGAPVFGVAALALCAVLLKKKH